MAPMERMVSLNKWAQVLEETWFHLGKWAQVLLAKHGFLRFLRKNHVDILRQTIFSDVILVPIVNFS